MKTVLITGTSSGIGTALVTEFADAGWQVISAMRSIVEDTRSNVQVVELDVCQRENIEYVVADAIKHYGHLDLLINNAGYGDNFALFEECAEDEMRNQMDTNFGGPVNLCRAVIPHMRAQGGGHIINVTSVAASVGFPYGSAYGASKFALRGFSLCLAEELLRYGIHISSFEPGMVKTRIAKSAHSLRSYPNPDLDEHYREVKAYADKVKEMYASNAPSSAKRVAKRMLGLAESKHPALVYNATYDASIMAWIRRIFSVRIAQWIFRRLS